VFSYDSSPDSGSVNFTTLSSNISDSTSYGFARALAKKALRKRLSKRSETFIEAATTFSTQLIMASSYDESPSKDVLDTDPIFSNVLGSIFFVLSVVALLVGHVDYMRCERALEDADKLIPQGAEDGTQSRIRIKWHNASSAKKAHSGR